MFSQLQETVFKLSKDFLNYYAYEPIWAIGTGKTASIDDIKEMHNSIESLLRLNLAQVSQNKQVYCMVGVLSQSTQKKFLI